MELLCSLKTGVSQLNINNVDWIIIIILDVFSSYWVPDVSMPNIRHSSLLTDQKEWVLHSVLNVQKLQFNESIWFEIIWPNCLYIFSNLDTLETFLLKVQILTFLKKLFFMFVRVFFFFFWKEDFLSWLLICWVWDQAAKKIYWRPLSMQSISLFRRLFTFFCPFTFLWSLFFHSCTLQTLFFCFFLCVHCWAPLSVYYESFFLRLFLFTCLFFNLSQTSPFLTFVGF
jgi:hypothetical protein